METLPAKKKEMLPTKKNKGLFSRIKNKVNASNKIFTSKENFSRALENYVRKNIIPKISETVRTIKVNQQESRINIKELQQRLDVLEQQKPNTLKEQVQSLTQEIKKIKKKAKVYFIIAIVINLIVATGFAILIKLP